MTRKSKWFLVFTFLYWCCIDVKGYDLLLNSITPITTGATLILNATVVDDYGACASGVMTFRYEDDAFPRHTFEIRIKQCVAIFNITFDTSIGPSSYRYKVDVLHELIPFINRPIASGRGQVNVTENLNGQLLIFQNNQTISKKDEPTIYVASNVETVHKVVLNAADFEYLNKSAITTTVYWFVDCIYKANSSVYTFTSNYSDPNTHHEILGIVVASLKSSSPPPSPTANPNVTTSTVAPKTTTIASISSGTSNTTTTVYTTTDFVAATNFTTTTVAPLNVDAKFSHVITNSSYTTDCQNRRPVDLLLSAVQLKDQQKYGYFSQLLYVKDPISNVKTQGKVWIQEGEMLNLQVNCNGSGPFRYCARFVQGPYNVSGNESCTWEKNLIQCQMQFFHYFHDPTNYTLIIIMANDVSKIISLVGINIYKVQKQPQISVIVVPVTFSSIAVIIVVFGIAYYFQNRSRYMVEVADFDFANNSDMEYKTFKERLRDAISQAINRTQDYSEYDGSEEHVGGSATPQNQKYGSMQ